MLSFKVKELFFDRKAVLDAAGRATVKALGQIGANVRRAAQTSMPRRKKPKPSAPGTPPVARKGQLRKFIFFGYEPGSRTVVIGPVKLGSSNVPALQEEGGTSTLRRWVSRRIGGKARSKRQAAAYRQKVIRGEIVPEGRQLVGFTARYPARPYMGPALAKEAPKMPERWRNSVKEG